LLFGVINDADLAGANLSVAAVQGFAGMK